MLRFQNQRIFEETCFDEQNLKPVQVVSFKQKFYKRCFYALNYFEEFILLIYLGSPAK